MVYSNTPGRRAGLNLPSSEQFLEASFFSNDLFSQVYVLQFWNPRLPKGISLESRLGLLKNTLGR